MYASSLGFPCTINDEGSISNVCGKHICEKSYFLKLYSVSIYVCKSYTAVLGAPNIMSPEKRRVSEILGFVIRKLK